MNIELDGDERVAKEIFDEMVGGIGILSDLNIILK